MLAAKWRHDPDSFACNSRYFVLVGHPKHPDVVSPDGNSDIHLTENFAFRVLSRGKKVTTLSYKDMSCCIEVGWSPDSKQFFIMYSDGGAVGGFITHVFRIAGTHAFESPATRTVANRFRSHHYSTFPGINLYFLDWTPDSRRVFLVAEVPPASYYGKHMGFYAGFLADVASGRILRRFDEGKTNAIEKSCRATGSLPLSLLRQASQPLSTLQGAAR